jgi:Holliday junction resolvase
MVDSREKGSRGEYQVRDLLREHTGLGFERVPLSGALAYLKGDIYIPNRHNRFCIECKFYEESALNDKILTNKSNNLVKWWAKIVEQASNHSQEPLLLFKYNRSKIFVATQDKPNNVNNYLYIGPLECYTLLASDWLINEKPRFLGDD